MYEGITARRLPDLGTLQRLEFLLMALAGCINQHDLRIIDYLLAENRVFREVDQAREHGSTYSLQPVSGLVDCSNITTGKRHEQCFVFGGEF